MTKLYIEKNVAREYIENAKKQREDFKRDLTNALKEYCASWYHQERVEHQKKHPKWTHPRIDDVTALEKIIKTSTTTTDLADKIIDYIDGDNDHFWFAWFSPLRGYMRDAVEAFTDKLDTKIIDHDLKLVSEKPPSQIISSQSPQRKNSDSLSDTEMDNESHTEDHSEFQERIEALGQQLNGIEKKLAQKNRELETKASELSELKKLIETTKDPQIQQLTRQLTDARQQLEQKARDLQTKTKEFSDLKEQSHTQKDSQLQQLTQDLETAKQLLVQKTRELEEAKTKLAQPIQPEPRRAAAIKNASPVKRALPAGPPPKPTSVLDSSAASTSDLTSSLAPAPSQATAVVNHNENEVIVLREKLAEIQDKLDAAQREKHTLLEKAKESEAKIKASEEISAQLNKSEQVKRELVEQVAQLTGQIQELLRLRGALGASELQIKTLEEQLSALRKETDQSGLLEQTQAKLLETQSENRSLFEKSRQFEAQAQELERLRSELAASSSLSESLQSELDKVKSNIEILEQAQAKLRTLEEEKESHAKQLQNLETQLTDQTELNQTLTTSSREFNNTLEEKARQLEEQISKLQQSRDELTQTKDLLSSALKAQTALQKKLDQSNVENSRLREENQTLKKENLTKGEKINAQSEQIELLQRIISELKVKFTQFQSIANNVVDSLTTMFQSASMYFRKSIVDKKGITKSSAKSKTSTESSTNDGEKRKSGFGFGKKKDAKDSSSEETKTDQQPKKTLFGSLSKKTGGAAVAKENIVLDLTNLDGKALRDAARKQIATKQGDAYNLTVDSIVPNTSKTADVMVQEFFESESTLFTAFTQADQLLAAAQDEIVCDDTVDRTLARDIALEKELVQAKSENDSLKRRIAEQLTLISKAKDAAAQSTLKDVERIRELEQELNSEKKQTKTLRVQLDDLKSKAQDNTTQTVPAALISTESTVPLERLRELEQELDSEKKQTKTLRAQLDDLKSKAQDNTTQTVPAALISTESTVPLERFESLQTEFAQLKEQIEVLKAATVSSTNVDDDQASNNSAAPPPPPAAPAPPPPPGVNSTPATPYRKSTTTSNPAATSNPATFFAQPATEEVKPLSIAEEFALRQKAGTKLRQAAVVEKSKPKQEENLGAFAHFAHSAVLKRYATMRKIEAEEGAQDGSESDDEFGCGNN